MSKTGHIGGRMGKSMKSFSKLFGLVAFLAAIGLGSPAMAQLSDFEDDPGASTQTDALIDQGTALANRTIQGRTQGAIKTGFYGNFFGGAEAVQNNDGLTVVAGTDGHSGGFFSDFWSDVAVWSNLSSLTIDDTPLDFEADSRIMSGLIGMDKFVTENILVGAVVGLTSGDTDAIASLAGGQVSLRTDTKTHLISVYGAYVLNDFVYFDAAFGVSDEEVSTTGITVATGNLNVQNDTTGSTRFGSVGATVAVPFEEVWLMTGNISYLRSITKLGAIRDNVSNVTIGGQGSDSAILTLGTQVARAFQGGSFVPYAGFAFEKNYQDQVIGLPLGAAGASGLTDQQTNDQSQGIITVGLDFFPADNLSVSMEGQRFVMRDSQKSWGGFFNFRYNF